MDMMKKSNMGSKVIEVLHLIYKTYHFSPKSKRELKALAENLQVRVKCPTRVKGTRWSPHTEKALDIMLSPQKGQGNEAEGQYSVVYNHMEHLASTSTNADIKGRARFLVKAMKSFQFVSFCHLLKDILKVVSALSLTLQKNDTLLTTACSAIKSCMLELDTQKTVPLEDGAIQTLFDSMKRQFENEPQLDSAVFQGIQLTESVPDNIDETDSYDCMPLSFRRAVTEAVTLVKDGMRSRYSSILKDVAEVQSAQKVVTNFRIVFNPDRWPDNDETLSHYGNEEVVGLVQWFETVLQRNGCATDRVLPEWRALKVLVSSEFRSKATATVWQIFLTKEPYCDDFKNLLMLVKVMLVLPVSSAQCERTFSAMNRIKSDVRSSLNVTTLEDLIRISSEGPSIEEFDAKKPVQRWMTVPRKTKLNYECWPDDCDVCDTED